MSSTNIDYDIIHYQGDTYRLTFNYLNDDNTPIDLSGFSADMHIRKSPTVEKLVGRVTSDYPQGCFGRKDKRDFLLNYGTTGSTGGIILNYNGVTGSVYIEIDADTVSTIPSGRNFYDLVIYNKYYVKNVLSGTFDLSKEVSI